MNELMTKITQTINDKGFFVALFDGEGTMPAFAYSIGLYKNYKHPEIIMFGGRLSAAWG